MLALFEKNLRCLKNISAPCWAAFVVLDILFSLSVVASDHIVKTGGEWGTLAENYITPYVASDVVSFILCMLLFGALGVIALAFLVRFSQRGKASLLEERVAPVRFKPILVMAVILFLAYVPYLLAYWPGLIFGDSLSSIGQAVGWYPNSNHHPFLYTLCIKVFFGIAHVLGLSNTVACVMYSITQMTLMSFGFAFLIQWTIQRTGCRMAWRVALVAVYALSPYLASYAIAMWKDPLFSLALAVVCTLVFDFVVSSGRIVAKTKAWLPLFVACLLVVAFFRSNGVMIVALLALAFAFVACAKKGLRRAFSKMAAFCGVLACAVCVVTGPVYSALGVLHTEKVEALGIPLGQMAMVAAMDGDMSEDDAAFMDEMLPLDEYAEVYAPMCIDALKWNVQFNSGAIGPDFLGHWLSMFQKNPGKFVEAWELQTFGYWSVNNQAVVSYSANIATGDPRFYETSEELSMLGIVSRNLLGGEVGLNALPVSAPYIPASWVLWLSLFVGLAFFALKRGRLVLALVPVLALVLSLLVASPIWYWPRYVAALQFLLPCIVAMLVVACKSARASMCDTMLG